MLSSRPSAEKLKDTEVSAVTLSAKKFPGSMVVLNSFFHVSNIFNCGFCFQLFSSQKKRRPWGRDPAP